MLIAERHRRICTRARSEDGSVLIQNEHPGDRRAKKKRRVERHEAARTRRDD